MATSGKVNKVLVIAYIFPPLGGSGVYRTAKFVRYLPHFGWQPVVVCGSDPDALSTGVDETLLSEIPASVAVHRMGHKSLRGPRRAARRWLARASKYSHVETNEAGASAGDMRPSARPGIPGRLVHGLNCLTSPIEFPPIDDALYWALAIVPKCLRIIRQQDIQVIFTTSFPYSDHVAGLILHRLTGKPWIADFRDPWSQNPAARLQGWRRRCDVSVERQVLESADRVVGVTPTWTEQLRSLAPGRSPIDFVTIENGFDATDFDNRTVQAMPVAPEPQDGTLLAHIGYVYPGTLIPFLRILDGNSPEIASLRMRFVGGVPQPDAACLQRQLPQPIEIIGRCCHEQAVEHMRSADALLLLDGTQPEWLGHYPGKLFEYMRAGKPILLVGGDGDAARLLETSGTGCRLPLEVPERAVEMLAMLAGDLQGFRERYFHPDPDMIARFDRSALTGRLAGLLYELAGR